MEMPLPSGRVFSHGRDKQDAENIGDVCDGCEGEKLKLERRMGEVSRGGDMLDEVAREGRAGLTLRTTPPTLTHGPLSIQVEPVTPALAQRNSSEQL